LASPQAAGRDSLFARLPVLTWSSVVERIDFHVRLVVLLFLLFVASALMPLQLW
jgi:hypothetical protein